MKKTMLFLLLVTASSAFANPSVDLAPINFQVSSANVLSKFEQTVNYPEGLLKRFQPVGAKITNKRVSQNTISFVATKTALFISKSVYVNGVFDSREDDRACAKGDNGYRLTMRFDASADLVSDNVDSVEAIICLHSQNDKTLTGVAKAKVIHGNRYSKLLGPTAVSLIKEQVPGLLSALTEEIKSLR